MRIFDTHAHYDSGQFEEDRDELLEKIYEATGESGGVPVRRTINVGADMASSQTTLELSRKYDHIFAAVGVHPDSAGELIWCPEKCAKYENEIIDASAIKDSEDNLGQEIGNADDSDTEDPYKDITEEICNRNRELLRNLAQQKKVVAIGEIGLDYHWDVWPRDIQKKAFEWQWKLAEELKLPVIIHSRDAAEDTLNMIRGFYETKRNTGVLQKAVMHCYSYSPEHAEEYQKMGLMFGIGGVVTFKNAKKLKEVVDLLPLDKILLETDCPYMAPDPFRGKRNNSGYLTYVAEKIAEIKGVDVKTVYDRTWDNAKEFFGLANI